VKTKKLELWSVPVWKIDTGLSKEFNNSLWTEISSASAKSGSHFDLFESQGKAIQELRGLIESSAQTSIAKHVGYECKLSTMRAWVNVTGHTDEALEPHTHANATLAAVYYLSAPEDSGVLWLINPSPLGVNTTGDSAAGIKIQPTEGQLVIFPGSIPHYVVGKKTSQPRISIACNLKINRRTV
jgi:uncharacterized protein (TIGR02466 family)